VTSVNIAYGLSGEGRGHSTRAITVAPYLLLTGHKITFFTCCQAVQPLREKGYIVNELPTPRIQYDKNNNPSSLGTMLYYPAWFLRNRGKVIDLANYLKEHNYDLIISDYEPLLSRAAKLANIPLIIYNNQSFGTHCKLPADCKTITTGDRLAMKQLNIINRMICPDANTTIIAKALPESSLVSKRNTHMVGPPIQECYRGKRWNGWNSNYIMVYHRKSFLSKMDEVIEFAESNGCTIKWYGAGEDMSMDNDIVQFCPEGPSFTRDLENCRYLITPAGASTIGEACHTGTPIILVPEKGQIEAELNAKLTSYYYPNACTLPMASVTAEELSRVTEDLHGLGECHIENGSWKVAEIINQFLKDYYSA
tara:strand:- start:1044 stop:2141 length:1098 start_codon:yes stop_codon:yes gene_type:complete